MKLFTLLCHLLYTDSDRITFLGLPVLSYHHMIHCQSVSISQKQERRQWRQERELALMDTADTQLKSAK